jgi:ubiquinone/menaquinone biosynthesis C-methylase UbiE
MPKDHKQQEITDYYNQLAHQYDDNRFGNSYGQYLHRQERSMLLNMVPKWQEPILSLGCGTGRLMELATHGADISPAMIDVAKGKYPDKIFTVCSATATPYAAGFFESGFCLHVLMHLPVDRIAAILAEAHRIIKPGGWLAVDFPNSIRRRLVHKKTDGWHGNTHFSIKPFAQLAGQNGWRLQQYMGLLLFPVHRLPKWARPLLSPIDTWLCRTPLKKYASYYLLLLQKQ